MKKMLDKLILRIQILLGNRCSCGWKLSPRGYYGEKSYCKKCLFKKKNKMTKTDWRRDPELVKQFIFMGMKKTDLEKRLKEDIEFLYLAVDGVPRKEWEETVLKFICENISKELKREREQVLEKIMDKFNKILLEGLKERE